MWGYGVLGAVVGFAVALSGVTAPPASAGAGAEAVAAYAAVERAAADAVTVSAQDGRKVVKEWRGLLAKATAGVPELARVTVAAASAAGGQESGLGLVSVSPVAGEALLSGAPSFTARVEVPQGGRGRLVVVWTTAAGGGEWGAVEGELVDSGAEAAVALPQGALASGRGYRFVVFVKDAAGAVGARQWRRCIARTVRRG